MQDPGLPKNRPGRGKGYDEFEGNDVGLLASAAEYEDEDDKEADVVWEAIDKRMDSRWKDRREARLKQEKIDKNPTKITQQFADLKRKLYTLSDQEWDAIPEFGDYSLRNNNKNKKKRFETFVADALLDKHMQEQEHVTALDPNGNAAD